MVSLVTLLQAIYDELKVIAQNSAGVSEPDDHVDILDRSEDIVTPFFGFDYTMNANPRGMGGNVRTLAVNTDADGDVTGRDRGRDYELMIDFGVRVDGDEPRTRDDYIGDIQLRMADFIEDASVLHDDVHRVRDSGIIPEGVQGGDVGALHTYSIEFVATDSVSLPTAEQVDWDVDVSGTDAYPEHY